MGVLPRRRGAGRPAVLMYHNVCPLPVEEAGFYQHVLPSQFADQMLFLRRGGWRVVSLMHLVDLLQAGRPLPPRTVAITFDDGYHDLLAAWPHLARRGYPATIFLTTGYVGKRSFCWLERYGEEVSGIRPLSWSEVDDLARQGAEFGSHTVSHMPAELLDDRQLLAELTRSKADIEERLGCPVSLFSLPFACPEGEGAWARLAALLARAGYSGAVTTAIGRLGPGADVMSLPRLPMSAYDSLATFEAKIEGAYDWLRPVQRAYKLWLKPHPRRPRLSPAMTQAPQLRGKP
jgi:peptidoglycan/xylan/chitin deacetylase (PgdA/CDA1 family)